jgi:hypothetical protein
MDKPTENIFFCVDKNGEQTDKGTLNELLRSDDEITRQLIEAGIIKEMHVTAEEACGE